MNKIMMMEVMKKKKIIKMFLVASVKKGLETLLNLKLEAF
jgi:hypothetical protein